MRILKLRRMLYSEKFVIGKYTLYNALIIFEQVPVITFTSEDKNVAEESKSREAFARKSGLESSFYSTYSIKFRKMPLRS